MFKNNTMENTFKYAITSVVSEISQFISLYLLRKDDSDVAKLFSRCQTDYSLKYMFTNPSLLLDECEQGHCIVSCGKWYVLFNMMREMNLPEEEFEKVVSEHEEAQFRLAHEEYKVYVRGFIHDHIVNILRTKYSTDEVERIDWMTLAEELAEQVKSTSM